MSPPSPPEGTESRPPFLSGPPLATIGPLSPDLLAAFNAAVYLAGTANTLCTLLSLDGPEPQEVVRGIISIVDSVRAVRNACNAAIAAVANDLNAVRDAPASFGDLVAPNAHQAASDFSRAVLSDIWNAAGPLAYAACFLDPSARMDSSLIAERFEDIRDHFRTTKFPKGDALIAQIQIEATKANRGHGARTCAVRRRDRKQEARDKWIYEQCCKGQEMPHRTIVAELKKIAPQKGWRLITTKNGIRQAAIKYADDHSKPRPPKRQDL
jgi:hypothetical protein